MIHIFRVFFMISRKGKNATETQNKKGLCSVWRRCCDWSNTSEVVCEVSWYYCHFGQIVPCCGAVLCIGRCLAAPLASPHQKPIAGDRWHTQNIQINKVIGENEKCVLWRKPYRLFGQPNTYTEEHILFDFICMKLQKGLFNPRQKNVRTVIASGMEGKSYSRKSYEGAPV